MKELVVAKKPTKEGMTERVEFMAKPSWVRNLEKAAEEAGFSNTSEFIRYSCTKEMKRLGQEESEPDAK